MKSILILFFFLLSSNWLNAQNMSWVRAEDNTLSTGSCTETSDCSATTPIHCYSLIYTPTFVDEATGMAAPENELQLNSYTTFFEMDCAANNLTSVQSMASCIMIDNSDSLNVCPALGQRFNLSGNGGTSMVTKGVSYTIHTICFEVPDGDTLAINIRTGPVQSNASLGTGGSAITENLDVADLVINSTALCNPPPPNFVGINEPNPLQMLHVNGALLIGNGNDDEPGSLRYRNGDFEGFGANGWTKLSDNLGNHLATEDLDMAAQKITDLGTPTQLSDAATKGYVDAHTDNDSDPTNELTLDFGLNSDILSYKDNSGTYNADLSVYDNGWIKNVNDNLSYFDGDVVISSSSTSPSDMFTVVDGGIDITRNSTGSNGQLDLTESESNDGARINFLNTGSASNLWTLYGYSNNTPENSRFNIYHSGTGNILTAKGSGDLGVGGTPNTDLHLYHGTNVSADGLKIQNVGSNNNWMRFYVFNSSGNMNLYSTNQGATSIGNFNAVTGAYASTSDRRLKRDFVDLYFDWDQFMNLRPLTYIYKNDRVGKRRIGMVAQDVEEIYPELINYQKEDQIYHMEYGAISVVAIKAIQEQQRIIEELKTQVAELKSENAKIENLEQSFIRMEHIIESLQTSKRSNLNDQAVK